MRFESFEERILDPKMWVYKGDELRYSADVLSSFALIQVRRNRKFSEGVTYSTHLSVMPQVIMLYSYAMENYIKALLVRMKKITIRDGKLIGVSHKLVEMLKEVGIATDDIQNELLEKYERHIFWEGRYPGPTKKSDLVEIYDKTTIRKWPNTYVVDHDIVIIKSIIAQLLEIIEESIFKAKNENEEGEVVE